MADHLIARVAAGEPENEEGAERLKLLRAF